MSSSDAAARGFIPPRNDDEKLHMRRVEELCRVAQQRGIPRYSGFLSDREQDLAVAAMNRADCTCGHFEGGYPDAERRVLCVEPPDAWQEMPAALFKISAGGRQAGLDQLTHRDCLGALLGLGVERSCLGDILPEPGAAGIWYVFCLAEKLDFFCGELHELGRVRVQAEPCAALPPQVLAAAVQREVKQATVPSLRADTVLAAMQHCSRGDAAEQIAAGRVEINHVPLISAHETVYAHDIFTVRGIGRFRLEEIGGKSKKDRIFISFFQY